MVSSIHYIAPLAGTTITLVLFAVIIARFSAKSTGVIIISVTRRDDSFIYTYKNVASMAQGSSRLVVLGTASSVELYQTDATNQNHPLSSFPAAEYLLHGRSIGLEEYSRRIQTTTKGLAVRLHPTTLGSHSDEVSIVNNTKELLESIHQHAIDE